MRKSRQIKKRNIVVDETQYVYSVTEYTDDVQVRVYKNKILILNIHLSYPESWGIDVFRPKTIEMLIKYYNKNYVYSGKITELWLFQEKELFENYLEYFFSDENTEKKERYLKHIQEFKHPKQMEIK
ncbi:hypothetical protein [Sebaldella sp. S0638]|uniref:hypothetical protein n=1 Tax=Sebaldella sp. S0638 TaxID=2957809 RepID=UPI00209F2332|nr:hypothetical protein [Sebaldella sp. S0638]MCP1222790.1 hypothetical protein [Sebaldella sp. S0638]